MGVEQFGDSLLAQRIQISKEIKEIEKALPKTKNAYWVNSMEAFLREGSLDGEGMIDASIKKELDFLATKFENLFREIDQNLKMKLGLIGQQIVKTMRMVLNVVEKGGNIGDVVYLLENVTESLAQLTSQNNEIKKNGSVGPSNIHDIVSSRMGIDKFNTL